MNKSLFLVVFAVYSAWVTPAYSSLIKGVSGEVVIELQNEFNADSNEQEIDGDNNLFL